MPTGNEPYTTYDRGWIIRVQPPKTSAENANAAPRILLLLHGWTGDETVMWIFTRSLPEDYWIFAPRGPVPAAEGGYGWMPRDESTESWPVLADFKGIADALLDAFQHWTHQAHLPRVPFDVMGFSQGAAMSYALAAYYPHLIKRVIALAGFLPRSESVPGPYRALNGKNIYIAHGTKDDTVPLHFATEAVRILESAGAQVTYCESDVGHKLSASCLRGLDIFLY